MFLMMELVVTSQIEMWPSFFVAQLPEGFWQVWPQAALAVPPVSKMERICMAFWDVGFPWTYWSISIAELAVAVSRSCLRMAPLSCPCPFWLYLSCAAVIRILD